MNDTQMIFSTANPHQRLLKVQKTIWFTHLVEPQTITNVSLVFEIDGPIDTAQLNQCIEQLIANQPILNSSIHSQGAKLELIPSPLQSSPLQVVNLDVEHESQIYQYINETISTAFELNKVPLFKTQLIESKRQKSFLVLVAHPIIIDRPGLIQCVNRISNYYQQLSQTQSIVSVSTNDFQTLTEYEQQFCTTEQFKQSQRYWCHYLKDNTFEININDETQSPAENQWIKQNKKLQQKLNSLQTLKVNQISEKFNCRAELIFLLIYQILLSRYTQKNDIIVNLEQDLTFEHFENQPIGPTRNHLPYRMVINGDQSFEQHLPQAIQHHHYNQHHKNCHLLDMVKMIRERVNHEFTGTFSNVSFRVKQDRKIQLKLDDINAKHLPNLSPTKSTHQINLTLRKQGPDYHIEMTHNDQLSRDRALAFFQHYLNLLNNILEQPKQAISQQRFLTSTEYYHLIEKQLETTQPDQDANVVTEFEAYVNYHPDQVAVKFEDNTISYQDLNNQANQLARHIQSRFQDQFNRLPQKNDLIGLYLSRSINMIIATLAILKCGCAYVPLDADYPEERLNYLIEDTQMQCCITAEQNLSNLDQAHALIEINILNDHTKIDSYPENNLNIEIEEDDLAYIIYTSGSTGNPKGVLTPHQSLVSLIEYQNQIFQIEKKDKILQVGSMNFDVSTSEIYGALLGSSQLVIANNQLRKYPQLLQQYIIDEAVNIVIITPSVLSLFENKAMPSVRTIVTIGEACPTHVMEYWSKQHRFINGYGPTETTVYSNLQQLDHHKKINNLGIGISHSVNLILDDNLQPVPYGVEGEHYIGGLGVALGYLNRPELTAEKFITNPFSNNPDDRLYCSGDKVIRSSDGDIHYLGRRDSQVKIRGQRIELEEIEKQLLKLADIKQVIVTTTTINKQLSIVAYYKTATEKKIQQNIIIEHCKNHLPHHMAPSFLIEIDEIPITPNGKLDFRALPKPTPSSTQKSSGAKNQLQKKLIAIWKLILSEIDEISIHDDFFSIGGHSLLATQMCVKIQRELGYNLPIKQVFMLRTIRKISQFLDQQQPVNLNGFNIQKAPELQHYPMNSAQSRMFYAHQLEPSTTIYNLPFMIHFDNINIDFLHQALVLIIKHNDIFNIQCKFIDGIPVMVKKDCLIESIDIDNNAPDQAWIEKNNQHIFNLVEHPLFFFKLFSTDNKVSLYFHIHHIIFDGSSLKQFMTELDYYYQQIVQNKSIKPYCKPYDYLDITYSQSSWLNNQAMQQQKQYWKQQLQSVDPILKIPTDFERPSLQSFSGDIVPIRLSKQLHQSVITIAKDEKVSVFSVLLTCFQVLLYRYSQQTSVTVGAPIANRNHYGTEPVMGLLVNALPYTNSIHQEASFLECLHATNEQIINHSENQELPLDQIIEQIKYEKDVSRNPLFQTIFTLQTGHCLEGKLNDTCAYQIDEYHGGGSMVDISMVLNKFNNGELKGHIEFCTDLFSRDSIERLAVHFQHLIESCCQFPNHSVTDLNILDQHAHQDFTSTLSHGPQSTLACASLIEYLNHYYFDSNDIALSYGNDQRRYQQLIQQYQGIAKQLLQLQPQNSKQSFIAIFLPRGCDIIVAMLACMQASMPFLILDPDYPAARIEYMLKDANIDYLLTLSDYPPSFNTSIQMVYLDQLEYSNNDTDAISLPIPKAQDLCYLVYTSGSTGNPKGVQIHHLGFYNTIVSQADFLDIQANDNCLQCASFNFDAALSEIGVALVSGAQLTIANSEARVNPLALHQFIVDYKIHVAQITPVMLECFPQQPIPSMKTLVVAGDTCAQHTMDYWAQQTHFINAYGPSEMSICATMKHVTPGTAHNNIGKAIHNTQTYVLDPHLNPTTTHVPGELYLSGLGQSSGYLYKIEKTIDSFIPNPFSNNPNDKLYKTGDRVCWNPEGELLFLGRNDNQISLRGFRIELGEIQSTVETHPMVKQCVITSIELGQQQIACFIISNDQTIDQAKLKTSLKQHCQQQLPQYMCPSFIMALDRFPVTPNGKVDKNCLNQLAKDHNQTQANDTPAVTETQKLLAAVWSEHLKVAVNDIHTSFFDLGGNSLLAAVMINTLKQQHQFTISLRDLHRLPTIAALAELITQPEENQNESILTTLIADIDSAQHAPCSSATLQPLSADLPQTILLTGATGFLGAHLLAQLVADHHQVNCLVRKGKQFDTLQDKINHQLTQLNLIHLMDHPNITWIEADLTQPQLGCDDTQWQWLIDHVQQIFHVGAQVNHVADYNSLRPANIQSLLELFHLQQNGIIKTLHFISTVSVDNIQTQPKDYQLIQADHIDSTIGYIQTKWAAEAICQKAIQQGWPVIIYRPGNITGHSQTGLTLAENNHALSLLKGCLQMQQVPQWEKLSLEMMPVDTLAKWIKALASEYSTLGQCYNLHNPHAIAWQDYLNFFQDQGFQFSWCSPLKWQQSLEALQPDNALFRLKDLYQSMEKINELSSQHHDTQLESIQIAQQHNVKLPQCYHTLLNHYYRYFMNTAFLI